MATTEHNKVHNNTRTINNTKHLLQMLKREKCKYHTLLEATSSK